MLLLTRSLASCLLGLLGLLGLLRMTVGLLGLLVSVLCVSLGLLGLRLRRLLEGRGLPHRIVHELTHRGREAGKHPRTTTAATAHASP